jgi:putative sulfotransferase
MISNMLVKHPDVLSLSELFSSITDLGSLTSEAFPEGVIDARQFWNIVGVPHPKQNLLKRFGLLPLNIMPIFRGESGIPPLMMQTLPHITRDYEALFDEIEAFVLSQEPVLLQQQYLRLFTWMQQRFKRQAWVERSGGSLRFTQHFYGLFPDARFIHIVRDGRDVAVSMSKEPAFRMILLTHQFIEKLGLDPFVSQDRSGIGKLNDKLRLLLPEYFDASVFRQYNLPLSHYGRYWSDEIIRGLRLLREVPAQRVLTLCYEDFLKEPAASAKKLIAFIDPAFAHEDWVSNVVPMVKSARSSWKALLPLEQEYLNEACLPGFAALKSLQLSWE